MIKIVSNTRVLAITIWLLAVSLSVAWNVVDDRREESVIALETARAFFGQIILSRRWNLMHGGVYVHTSDLAPPNPYLPEDQRTIRDENGRTMTLINPAYMTRQIAGLAQKKELVRFHITSLTPLRRENKALDWELPWLQDFEKGAKERYSFLKKDTSKIFRYMAPLPFTETCLPCHDEQGHGSIRGAISVTLPFKFHKPPWQLLLSHFLVALIGVGGIIFFANRLARSRNKILQTNEQLQKEIEERKQTETELISIRDNLETIVDNRTAELRSTNESLDARITEQQKIEASLVSINDEFIQIFNSAPDGMHIIDRQFTIIRANRAFCKLTGKSLSQIQGRKCYEAFSGKFCHTEDCPLSRIINGAERVELEAYKTPTDGERIPCIVTATPFREPSGKLIGIIEVTRDISNWKKVEESLSSAAEHLRARNTELEDFTHVISHDLQEPLMLISAFSERIRNKCSDALPEQGVAYLERIENSTNRMQSLIDGLLLYSRVTSKATPFEQVHLNTIVGSVLDDLAITIERNNARITVEGDLGTIDAEPLQMRQLFQNIIGNSIKYHHEGRDPKIRIKRIPLPDSVSDQNYIRISIKDNGIGFDPKFQDAIFDIFQRLHTRQKFKGTGIGLSICKKIIDRHHGTISASGEPDHGAEFIITLPPVQRTSLTDNDHRDTHFIDIVMHRR